MKSIIIGLTFSLVSVLTIMLLFLSYQKGGLFYVKDMWVSLVSRLSDMEFMTKSQFDKLLDRFNYISTFKIPSISDGLIDLVISLFKLLGNFVGVIFNILGVVVGLLVDVYSLVSIFWDSIVDGWRLGANPIVL